MATHYKLDQQVAVGGEASETPKTGGDQSKTVSEREVRWILQLRVITSYYFTSVNRVMG